MVDEGCNCLESLMAETVVRLRRIVKAETNSKQVIYENLVGNYSAKKVQRRKLMEVNGINSAESSLCSYCTDNIDHPLALSRLIILGVLELLTSLLLVLLS
tara:strand:- start:630 stop:932 length:303 start_codon:yes stop_codon:yes gene_type:complete